MQLYKQCWSNQGNLAHAGLAHQVGKAFIVGTTHPDVRKAAEANPDTFVLSSTGGILATEECLLKVWMAPA